MSSQTQTDHTYWGSEWEQFTPAPDSDSDALNQLRHRLLGKDTDHTPSMKIERGASVFTKTRVIVVVACVLVITIGACVRMVVNTNAASRAVADCEQSISSQNDAVQRWKASRKHAQPLMSTPADQVSDSNTLSDLKKAFNQDIHPATVTCNTRSRSDMEAAISTAQSTTVSIDTMTQRLDDASKKVAASKHAKTVDIARVAFDQTLMTAKTMSASSDGKVADPSTREALMTVIKEHENISRDDVTKMSASKDALNTAIAAVQRSIQDKDTADRQAAQAAIPPTPQPAPDTSRIQPNYQPRRNGGGIPARPVPAPAPAAPAPSHGHGWYVPPSDNGNSLPGHL
jgi:hypothetical protein